VTGDESQEIKANELYIPLEKQIQMNKRKRKFLYVYCLVSNFKGKENFYLRLNGIQVLNKLV